MKMKENNIILNDGYGFNVLFIALQLLIQLNKSNQFSIDLWGKGGLVFYFQQLINICGFHMGESILILCSIIRLYK